MQRTRPAARRRYHQPGPGRNHRLGAANLRRPAARRWAETGPSASPAEEGNGSGRLAGAGGNVCPVPFPRGNTPVKGHGARRPRSGPMGSRRSLRQRVRPLPATLRCSAGGGKERRRGRAAEGRDHRRAQGEESGRQRQLEVTGPPVPPPRRGAHHGGARRRAPTGGGARGRLAREESGGAAQAAAVAE